MILYRFFLNILLIKDTIYLREGTKGNRKQEVVKLWGGGIDWEVENFYEIIPLYDICSVIEQR